MKPSAALRRAAFAQPTHIIGQYAKFIRGVLAHVERTAMRAAEHVESGVSRLNMGEALHLDKVQLARKIRGFVAATDKYSTEQFLRVFARARPRRRTRARRDAKDPLRGRNQGPAPRHGVPSIPTINPAARDAHIARNVRLISSIASDKLREAQGLIQRAISEGTHPGQLRKELQERFGMGRARADLIARDQTLKLHAQLTKDRQTASGISKYVWTTVGDERVRGTPGGKWPKGGHYDLDGTEQSWDDPPVVSEDGKRAHPGEDYQCRCTAFPVLDFGDETEEPQESAEERTMIEDIPVDGEGKLFPDLRETLTKAEVQTLPFKERQGLKGATERGKALHAALEARGFSTKGLTDDGVEARLRKVLNGKVDPKWRRA